MFNSLFIQLQQYPNYISFLYPLVIVLPLIASVIIPIILKFKLFNQNIVLNLNLFGMFLTFVISWFILQDITENLKGQTIEIIFWNWFEIDSFVVNLCGFFDPLTAVMLVVISTVSFFVHVYATSYMETDPNLPRFMS